MTPPSGSILLVAEDAESCGAFRQALRALPVALRIAATAADAMALIAAEAPALLVSGYTLPDIDGVELIRQVRSKYPLIRCMLYTNATYPAKSLGEDIPTLGKPTPPDEIAELIGDLVGLAKSP